MSGKNAKTYLGHLNTTLQKGIYLRMQTYETLLLILVTVSHLEDTCLKSTTKTREEHLPVDVPVHLFPLPLLLTKDRYSAIGLHVNEPCLWFYQVKKCFGLALSSVCSL